jgi:uncharacterized membrane protein
VVFVWAVVPVSLAVAVFLWTVGVWELVSLGVWWDRSTALGRLLGLWVSVLMMCCGFWAVTQ